MRLRTTLRIVAGASLIAAATLGCAEEREPINRVQANALKKSFFVGADLQSDADNPDFYANGTLLDIGYGAAQDGLFTAFYGNDLSIIRWEITEDQLIGRLAYERIDGTDGKGTGAETNDGQIIYAFSITSHFDIRRAYNPSTGEELNVIEENSSDRVWNEREYFRVDWSRNMVTTAYDFDVLAQYGAIFGAYDYEEVGYYVNDPNHEHAPNFETDDGYFDVTTRAYAKPASIDLPAFFGLDSLPACFLDPDFSGGTAPSGNCNPVEITIRHSFWKAPDNDYEPADWDGYRFQAAGAFTKDRYGFARNYGMTDTKWRRFISRYNIWERSHFYADPENMTGPVECFTPTTTPVGADPNRDQDGNGTADECEAVGNGSQCDQFSQKCTLPYAQREQRPIVWYYTNKSDYRYFEPTEWGTQEWDVAMRWAVMAARNAECERVGGQNCEADFPVPHGQSTMQQDAIGVWREVFACRKANNTWDTASCAGVVDDQLTKRGYDPAGPDYNALKTLALMDDMVVLCHSPIQENDHPLCAPGKTRLPAQYTAEMCQDAKASGDAALQKACSAAYTVRTGDVRRHLVNVIKSPETPSPWGFGPTYADPTTGEAISASINVWAWPTDFISQSTVDISRFIGGELSVQDVTDGEFVKDYADAVRAAATKGTALPPMTKEQVKSRKESLLKAVARDLETGKTYAPASASSVGGAPAGTKLVGSSALAKVPASINQKVDALRHVRAASDAPSAMQQTYFARMQSAWGTETEAALMGPAMQQAAGAGLLPAGAQAEFASPLRGRLNHSLQRDLSRLKELGLAERGACMLYADDFAPTPTAALGLAKILQQKFGQFNAADDTAKQLERADRMKRYMADRMHYAVMIHEMGHTFGYRHNFVSSSSAFNFRPQYWQLRTKNGTVQQPCTDLAEDEAAAANCVGPRYFDPKTTEEQDGMINMWAHSSVMDYAGEITQDLLGLGTYDFHAARMFYGDVASVFEDPEFSEGSALGGGISETILDSFGGILGYTYQSGPANFPEQNVIHYSQLQNAYGLIGNCRAVDPANYVPSYWNEERDGPWDPTLDGGLVKVNGEYQRCFQRRVDYVDWDQLRGAGSDPLSPSNNQADGRVGPGVDPFGRTRFPYAFATDRWADLGNLAVYRHDSGADAYELFEFLITEQELKHIFDNYRRNRQTFSVRSAQDRILGRYNAKMRDGAKGMTLIFNNLTNFAVDGGFDPISLFNAYVASFGWDENMLAAGMAFDHFTRQMQRPNAGPHSDPARSQFGGVIGDTTIPLAADEQGTAQSAILIVPDGTQGYWQSVGIGGKLVNNTLSSDRGEYDSEFTLNAGSYYDKINTTMLMTESVDNFISSSLDDFKDSRFRAVSLADLFADGYRRWLANNLTGDDFLKAPRVASDASGNPLLDPEKYPAQPLGWISWWPENPEICFANAGTQICSAYGIGGTPFKSLAPANTRPVDPQVGWEQQKFLMAWTLVYLPENQKQVWLDMMGIWEVGADSDPAFQNRIELHAPTGDVYVARSYGTEEICFEQCRTVERGIGARILQYANQLLQQAYVTTEVTVNGSTWYEPVFGPDGRPLVRFDREVSAINPNFTGGSLPADCAEDPDPNDSDYSSFEGCKCEYNTACMRLRDYLSVPAFMRQAMRDFNMADPTQKGIY